MKLIYCVFIGIGCLSRIPLCQAEVEQVLIFPRLPTSDTNSKQYKTNVVHEHLSEKKSDPSFKAETSIPPDTYGTAVSGNLIRPSQTEDLASNNGQNPNRFEYYLQSQFLSLPGIWESSPFKKQRLSSNTSHSSSFFSTTFFKRIPFNFVNFGAQKLPSSTNEINDN